VSSIADSALEKVQLYQTDPVSGAPITQIKEILVDLDAAVEDSSLEHLLTPDELIKVREERERRSRRMSGVNNSIVSS
jgi:hypothetical protein